ncbi:unnamed protein product [Microthlaspi erraticum]|uniref:FBD domain-containing protein n=1 Tax=Microthlaspi erraticum TaxID=1685480 RepID=A0A6D2L9K4_9BRAS|nr:unnamed protein product [Microthlaspi erraticum]
MDRISQLSDDLLIEILSLVPTKDAVAVSTLSKRWMSLWTLVPRLIFYDYFDEDDEYYYYSSEYFDHKEKHAKRLSRFVSGTLLLHKAAALESFYLKSATECSPSEVGLWVRIAVERFVRDLKIIFYGHHGLVHLPSNFFRCETLETLVLDRLIVSEVPCRCSFGSLKKLQLLSLKYSDDESFSRLTSSCPVLEDLVVETCLSDNVVTFTVNVPSLQSLFVRTQSTWQINIPDYHLFVIHSYSMNQLKVAGYRGKFDVIGDMPKFVKANFQSVCRHDKAVESSCFVKPLCVFDEEVVSLEICTHEYKSTMVVNAFQHSTKLQVLKLVYKPLCVLPRYVPECLLHHLKTFEWRDYEGTKYEKEVAIYILNNARRLVTATIYPLARKHCVFEELEIASRGSRACDLTMG